MNFSAMTVTPLGAILLFQFFFDPQKYSQGTDLSSKDGTTNLFRLTSPMRVVQYVINTDAHLRRSPCPKQSFCYWFFLSAQLYLRRYMPPAIVRAMFGIIITSTVSPSYPDLLLTEALLWRYGKRCSR